MRSTALLTATLGLLGATVAFAQTPTRHEGPGLKAGEDAREPAVLAQCKSPPPPRPNFGNSRPQPYAPADHVAAIPGVIAAGRQWKTLWQEQGNNADGIVGTRDGGVLVAQQDNSDVVKVDSAGHASIIYRDTNTGGALSSNKQGQLFVVERGLRQAIWELAPQHKLLANLYRGDPLDCLGAGGLNDLTAAANGGVYFTLGQLYYAAPDGTITRYGKITSYTNGIILSPDEKHLYVTDGGMLLAFDVQSDGSLTGQRTLATLPGGGGDGSTVDADGRIYVTGRAGVTVIAPDGTILGTIPPPRGTDLISVAFGGRGKRTLFAVALMQGAGHANNGLPGDRLAGEVAAIAMTAHGYSGRAK